MLIVRRNSFVVKKADFPPQFDLKLGYIYCKIILPNCSNDFFRCAERICGTGNGQARFWVKILQPPLFYKVVSQEHPQNEKNGRNEKMGRTSNKDNKTQYQICRENMGYSREKASEVLGWISADRIERIENGGFVPRSDEVLEMSRGYRNPNLCNYYCAHECPIGQQYVPEIKVKDLSRIVLEMLASLNAMQKKQERLIEITADGQISEDEMIDFTGIQAELEKISVTVETLQFWFEQMVADGEIKLQKNYCEAEK